MSYSQGISDLSGLDDVLLNNAGQADYLTYDSTTHKWRNATKQSQVISGKTVAAAVANGGPTSTVGWDYVCTGTNDEATLNSAVAAANGGPIYLSAGTFNIGNDINWTSGFLLKGAGTFETILQLGSGVTYGPYWHGTKVQLGSDNVVASAPAGTQTLTTSSDLSGSINPNDMILLTSGACFGSRSTYTIGEWAQVQAVTSSSISLQAPLRHDYNISDTLRLFKYNLISAAAICNLSVIGASSTSLEQQGVVFELCDKPLLADVFIQGVYFMNGVEIRESREAVLYRAHVADILDLNAPQDQMTHLNTFNGYGVHTLGCLDTKIIDLLAERCRHGFDDSSNTPPSPATIRRAPSLRTQLIRAKAVHCRAAGLSSHGGSDELHLDSCVSINSGGGFIFRGRATKGSVTVQGVETWPNGNEYTPIDGTTQSTQHAVYFGEPLKGTGAVSCAGYKVDIQIREIDVSGAAAGTNAVYVNSSCIVDDMKLSLGTIKGYTGVAINVTGPAIQRLHISNGTLIPDASNNNVGMQFQPTNYGGTAIDGNTVQNLEISNVTFNGYRNRLLTVYGNSANTAANLADDIFMHHCRAYNCNWSTSSPLVQLQTGYFSAAAGSVRVQQNSFREMTGSTVMLTNTATQSNADARQNLISSGYDIAPA